MARDSITCRTFLAIPLADAFSTAVTSILDETKRESEGIKWVDPAQIHLTLHFFGPTSSEAVDKIVSCVEPLAKSSAPLELALGEIGYFPGREKPRVIWVGLNGDVAELCVLQKEIEENLQGSGFVCETRPFHPHITLGRAKQGNKIRIPESSSLKLSLPINKTPRRIDRIILYRSDLTPMGPHYEALKTFLFAKGPRP